MHGNAADQPECGKHRKGYDNACHVAGYFSAEEDTVDAVQQRPGDGIDGLPEGAVCVAVGHIGDKAQHKNNEAKAQNKGRCRPQGGKADGKDRANGDFSAAGNGRADRLGDGKRRHSKQGGKIQKASPQRKSPPPPVKVGIGNLRQYLRRP